MTKERDMWREMAMNLIKFLPAPPPVVFPTPQPQVIPWVLPYPYPSTPWPPGIVITTTTGAVLGAGQ